MNWKLSLGTIALATTVLFLPATYAQKADTKNLTAKGTIQSIDKKEKTITIKVEEGSGSGKEKTLEVGANTKIDKDTKINLHLKDLSEGDTINVMYKKEKDPKTNTEGLKAVKITVLSSGATPPPAGSKP